jgi:hypothetical protein
MCRVRLDKNIEENLSFSYFYFFITSARRTFIHLIILLTYAYVHGLELLLSTIRTGVSCSKHLDSHELLGQEMRACSCPQEEVTSQSAYTLGSHGPADQTILTVVTNTDRLAAAASRLLQHAAADLERLLLIASWTTGWGQVPTN